MSAGLEDIAAGFGRVATSIEKLVDAEETSKRIAKVEDRLGNMEAQQSKILQILEGMSKKDWMIA